MLTPYYQLSPGLRGALAVWAFALLIMLAYHCIRLIRQKSRLRLLLLALALVGLTFGMITNLVLFSLYPPQQQQTYTMPLLVLLLAELIMTACAVFFLYRNHTWVRSHATNMSIKEAMDILPTGLCFCFPSGRTLMTNLTLHRISNLLFQRNVLNGRRFWEDLMAGRYGGSVQLLQGSDTPILLLPDETAWLFEHRLMPLTVAGKPIHEIMAVNVTEDYQNSRQILRDAERLQALNHHLKEYSRQVDDVIRAEENLALRTRIHSDAGKTLLAIKGYVQNAPGITAGELLRVWRENLLLMRGNATVPEEDSDPMNALQNAAAFLGAQVSVKGTVPAVDPARQLFFAAARECLTNTVHAGGDTLFIAVAETEQAYTLTYTNNGAPPRSPIQEGGGLHNLRSVVEQSGGSLRIRTLPNFSLTVIVAKSIGE